jgi:hypothetical protein
MYDLTSDPEYKKIAPLTMKALMNWGQHGLHPGDFVTAVLTNDLQGAVARADDQNRPMIDVICRFVHNQMPRGCHGSLDVMERYGKKTRAEGEREMRVDAGRKIIDGVADGNFEIASLDDNEVLEMVKDAIADLVAFAEDEHEGEETVAVDRLVRRVLSDAQDRREAVAPF